MNRLFKLFWVGVACAVFSVRFDADAATYRFDLPSKTLEGGTMALGENAELVLRNIGTADPAALRTLLCDKEGNYLAASTNGFQAAGTAAVGGMSLATAALAARFEGMSALKEIPLVFAVWDTANGTLLGSSLVQVKNNPLADADGAVPMDWGGVDYGDVAIAQQAYSMATNAWQLSVATSNRMDSLHGDYTAATNDLWEAVGGLESGTGALDDRIAALEGADFGGAISSSADSLRDELLDAMESDIEAAFTNGTARGLALSPLDAEVWEGSSLAETPGAYYTAQTNEFGVTIERLLHLVGGVQGIVAHGGPLKASGFTLGTNTVTDWGSLDQSAAVAALAETNDALWAYAQTNFADATGRIGVLEEDMGTAQTNIAALNSATGLLYRAATDAAAGVASNAAAIETLRTEEFVPRTGYEYDGENVATNLTWRFGRDGTYLNNLSVGGWERFVTVTNDGVPQTIVLRHTGKLGLNGREIDSWAALTNGLASILWCRSFVEEYVSEHQPNLYGYATLEDLANVSVDLSEVYGMIGEVSAAIPSLDGYATQPWTVEYVRTNLTGYAQRSYVTNLVYGLSNMLAGVTSTGTVDITDLWNVSEQLADLHEGVSNNAVAIDDLWDATTSLDGYIVDLENASGNYVAKTNGEWVVVQSGLWHGLRWAGKDLFGAALVVEPGQARITGFGVDSNGTATITFLGSETTNRLEATTDAVNWSLWDNCFWSYNGPTGTVAVVNAAEGAFYRIIAVDGAPGATTNAVMVSSVPIYVGDPSNSANRVATMADLPTVVDRVVRTRGATAKSLQPTGWEDPMNVEPKLLGWQFSPTGTYFKALTIGGHRYEEGGTNFLANGEMTLNGERIRHWAEIAAYAEGASIGVGTLNTLEGDVALEAGEGITIKTNAELGTITIESDATGSGFPLEADADFAGYAAENVGSIQFAGSTNELAIIDGKLKYGGKSVSGIPNLEAGRNIELAVDTTNEVVTISTTDDVSFGDVQVRGNLTVYGQQNIQTIRRYYTNVYLGTQTNYVTTEIHTTNHSWEVYHVVTRTTNNVDEVINGGGNVDHSKAEYVHTPSFSIDNSDTNAPILTGTGTWDLSGSSVDLGDNAVVTMNGMSGAVSIAPGANITFQTNDATQAITINATVPPSGVESLNTLTGALSLVGAGDVTITPSGSTITIYAESGGGGGWGAEAKSLYLTSSWNMPANANDYGAIGVNTINGDATITLAAQTNYQNVVITKFSNVNSLSVVGTTTNVLTYDGQSIILDYWPEMTNWYWRMY